MPQESYNYNSSYYHPSPEKDVWDDALCLYDDDDYMAVLSASITVPQPVVGLGLSIAEGERENLDMEVLGSACVNNGSYTVASTFITSTSNKSSHIFNVKEETYNEWQEKAVKQWSREDIMSWIVFVATENGLRCEDIMLSGFRDLNDGLGLCALTLDDFLRLEPNHGALFYHALQKLLISRSWHPDHDAYRGQGLDCALPGFNTSFRGEVDNRCPDPLATWQVPQLNLNNDDLTCERSSGLDSEGESQELKTKVKKKGVGRPPRDPKETANRTRTRRKSGQKCGRLWEFIRDLLKNQKYCPGDICWVDHDQGMFRFVQSERVAKLWGEIKKNPKMNYEKLSRAMRYYYKSKVLLPVLGRRLVYRFGPNATNWRSNNPNFLCKMTPSNQ
ncbi:ETS homologous factor-like [Hetaerina americana]|uniref:ETS homologous factor-like n=1 Tax=Hetaerina americana TaxID=62018 RepID=UPI003A7F51DD